MSGSLHLLWVTSEEKSFTSEIFRPLDSLGEDLTASCWRVVQKAGDQGAVLLHKGPWYDLSGTVHPYEFALSATLPALGQMSTAVFGLGTIGEPAADTAAELFDKHENRPMWSCGIAISRSGSRGETSTLPFSHWLDTRLGLGSTGGKPGLRLQQLLALFGPGGCVVVPGVSSDMHRATVWVSLGSFENAWFAAPGERITSQLAQRRGWSARVLD